MLHAPSSQGAGVEVVIIRAALGLSLSSSSEEPGTGVSPSLAAQAEPRCCSRCSVCCQLCCPCLWIKGSSTLSGRQTKTCKTSTVFFEMAPQLLNSLLQGYIIEAGPAALNLHRISKESASVAKTVVVSGNCLGSDL